jgi:hypothetical protein
MREAPWGAWKPARRLPLIAVAMAGALTFTLFVLASGGERAQAHGTPDNCVGVYYGNFPNTTQRGVACTSADHQRLDGCDRYADGLQARAWYSLAVSFLTGPGSWDPNGANSGCAHNYFAEPINQHRICVEQPVGCSSWVNS